MKSTILFAALAALAVPALAGDAAPAAHPHFNDGGALSWSVKLGDAKAAAKKSGKLIFIEYGREA